MSKEDAKMLGLLALFVLLILVAPLWAFFQWGECRDMGHSVFYCLGHILK